MTWREPIGVVAAIVPDNSPSFLWAQKVAVALCVGCTVVCKPSEQAPLGVTCPGAPAGRSDCRRAW